MSEPKKSSKKINSKGFSGLLLYPLAIAMFILSILVIPLISFAAPGVPYNVSVERFSAGDTALTVSWNNIGFGSGSGNRIWMNGRVISITTTALNATYNVTGLSPGVNYVFKIGAYDDTGYSDFSFPAAAITKTSAASNSFQKPHASFYDTTNMCSACHSVHKARTNIKALKFRYSNMTTEYSTLESTTTPAQLMPAVTLCFNCHDGQGAQYNVKRFYDQPTSSTVPWPGHMTRRNSTTTPEAAFGGWRYMGGQPAGQRQPCMICHDVHVSSKGNWKSLADDLVYYAVTTNSNNRWISTGGWNPGSSVTSDAATTGVIDTGTNPWEKCTVCHHDNSMTNSVMKVAGRDLFWPNSGNGTPPNQLPPTEPNDDHIGRTACDCHVGSSTNDVNNVHSLGKGAEPQSPVRSCACHSVLLTRVMSSSITSRHYISQSNDNMVPDSGTCVWKCHNNHPRNDNTHAANVYEDASVFPVSNRQSAAYDYNATTGEGLCLSCHKNVQQSERPGGTSNSTAFISPIDTQGFSQTSHNFFSYGYVPSNNNHFPPTNAFSGNCIKCHRDNSNDLYAKWGPHASSNRSLLVLPSASANLPAGSSERLCYNCHSTNSSSGSERMWAGRQMATVAWKISTAFGMNNWGHSYYLNSTSVDRHRASEGYTQSWISGWMPSTARHVECYDCHNPHKATQGYDYRAPLPLISSANDSSKDLEAPTKGYVSGPLRGVWGVYPTTNWNAIPTAANYYDNAWNGTTPINVLFFTASASKQAYICLKCHSPYAYGTNAANRPNIPSGVPSGTNAGPDNPIAAGRQSDILADFNPNNLGYHPVFSPGRNQPTMGQNPNWKGANGRNSAAYDRATVGTAGPGLTTSFVPPWGASSLVTCADCHSHNSSSYSRGYYTSAASIVNAWDGPRGPHGSSRRWMLRGVDRSIQYRKNNNAWYVYNSSLGSDGGLEVRYFCLNCHRADVYWGGDGNLATATGISRVNHIAYIDQRGTGEHGSGQLNVWGIACMNCHGGQTIGTIHGTGGAAPSGGPNRLGRRLIYGAVWNGYDLQSTQIQCYTKGSDDSVQSCSKHSGGTGLQGPIVRNYVY